uniref:Uncharacterized protein n=1 Tax=Poecilia latipinna TaxID=48699 RepID=A0A3B3UMC1_9TELE
YRLAKAFRVHTAINGHCAFSSPFHVFILPALKSSAAFHQQRRGLDRAQTEHKQKIRRESRSPEAIRMRILHEKSAKPQLQPKHVQHRNICLADDSNNKIAHRAGPIHRNILPADACFTQAGVTRKSRWHFLFVS